MPAEHRAPLLIAEDNDGDFIQFRHAVHEAGLENTLQRFHNGAELREFLLAAQPRTGEPRWLVFIDLAMPVVNGFEFLEWLRGAVLKVKIRPIILTNSRRDLDIKRAFARGADEYLLKPISAVLLGSLALGI